MRAEFRDRQLRNYIAVAALAVILITIAACHEGGANIRDCSQWRTESIPGCYDGQGGGAMP